MQCMPILVYLGLSSQEFLRWTNPLLQLGLGQRLAFSTIWSLSVAACVTLWGLK